MPSDPLRRREWDARHRPGPVRADSSARTRPCRRRAVARLAARPRCAAAAQAQASPAGDGSPAAAGPRPARGSRPQANRQRRRPDPFSASGREPTSDSYTWSAQDVPWWSSGPDRSRQGPGQGAGAADDGAAGPGRFADPGHDLADRRPDHIARARRARTSTSTTDHLVPPGRWLRARTSDGPDRMCRAGRPSRSASAGRPRPVRRRGARAKPDRSPYRRCRIPRRGIRRRRRASSRVRLAARRARPRAPRRPWAGRAGWSSDRRPADPRPGGGASGAGTWPSVGGRLLYAVLGWVAPAAVLTLGPIVVAMPVVTGVLGTGRRAAPRAARGVPRRRRGHGRPGRGGRARAWSGRLVRPARRALRGHRRGRHHPGLRRRRHPGLHGLADRAALVEPRGDSRHPRPHRAQPDRAAPPRHGADRAVQLPVRPAHGGTFMLRLEDTDVARSTAAFEKDILDGLHWLGIDWDEGPGGRRAARSAARTGRTARCSGWPRYAAAAERLLAADEAYPCFCTPEELDADRKAQEAAKLAAAVRRPVRAPDAPRSAPRARPRAAGPPSGSASAPGVVGLDDLVRGRVEIDTANLGGDFVIVRARRHAAVPLHRGRRRRRDGDQPRDPRRGPPVATRPSTSCCSGPSATPCRRSPTCR